MVTAVSAQLHLSQKLHYGRGVDPKLKDWLRWNATRTMEREDVSSAKQQKWLQHTIRDYWCGRTSTTPG